MMSGEQIQLTVLMETPLGLGAWPCLATSVSTAGNLLASPCPTRQCWAGFQHLASEVPSWHLSEEHRKCPYIPALPTAWSSGSKDCIHCHNPDIQHHASTPEACSMNTQQRQCLPAVARILISLSTQHLEPVCVKQTLFYCFIALSPPPTAVSWMSSQVPEHPSKHS